MKRNINDFNQDEKRCVDHLQIVKCLVFDADCDINSRNKKGILLHDSVAAIDAKYDIGLKYLSLQNDYLEEEEINNDISRNITVQEQQTENVSWQQHEGPIQTVGCFVILWIFVCTPDIAGLVVQVDCDDVTARFLLICGLLHMFVVVICVYAMYYSIFIWTDVVDNEDRDIVIMGCYSIYIFLVGTIGIILYLTVTSNSSNKQCKDLMLSWNVIAFIEGLFTLFCGYSIENDDENCDECCWCCDCECEDEECVCCGVNFDDD
eukprot:27460_1